MWMQLVVVDGAQKRSQVESPTTAAAQHQAKTMQGTLVHRQFWPNWTPPLDQRNGRDTGRDGKLWGWRLALLLLPLLVVVLENNKCFVAVAPYLSSGKVTYIREQTNMLEQVVEHDGRSVYIHIEWIIECLAWVNVVCSGQYMACIGMQLGWTRVKLSAEWLESVLLASFWVTF